MKKTAVQPKPQTTAARPELVRLPQNTFLRRVYRAFIHALLRLLVRLFVRLHLTGLENIPPEGPLLMVANHLGDADALVGLAYSPRPVDLIAKIDLYDLPIAGKLLDAYGVIWIHRGQPDRRALRAAVQGLRQGRLIAIAPEGRESLTGALEEGTQGAAFLALKSGAPLLPVTFTGSENSRVFPNLRRLRRTTITCTVGQPFFLETSGDFRADLEHGTHQIMQALAAQLPPEYRGVYT